jgi:hypothetical protein
MSTLNLNNLVKVNVYLSPIAAARKGFNLGLIIGASSIIPTSERVRIYTETKGMLEDGFKATDPEYKAALLYFGRTPAPSRLAVGVKAEGETAVQALTACRAANNEWYPFSLLDAEKADIVAMAAEVEAMQPATVQMYTTKDADVLAGTASNVLDTLEKLEYLRSIGQYSTTDYAIVSEMGYAMSMMTGFANSAYTLAYKKEPGVTPEALTQTQYENITTKYTGNVYSNFGSYYNLFQNGKIANGAWFDEVINLDKLSNDLQLEGADALGQVPKIPQTEDGMTYLNNRLTAPLEQAVKIGFIAPGKWTAPDLLTLKYGDFLPKGYLILSDSIADQAQADREARKAPPIYIPIKLAGAIQNVVIGVYVNR